MSFTQYDIGPQVRGTVVEVTLSGSAANVRLLDTPNFRNYRIGRSHQYVGGLIRRSPAQLAVPNTGTWHVVVDLQGLRGQAGSSVRVIPSAETSPGSESSSGPLSEIKQAGSSVVPDGGPEVREAVEEGEAEVVRGDEDSVVKDLEDRIREHTELNARLRELLDARDEAEQKIVTLQSTAQDLQSRLRKLELELSGEHGDEQQKDGSNGDEGRVVDA